MAGVSVCVASFRERRLLDACLGSLIEQSKRADASIVVARDGDEHETAQLARDWPDVTFVRAERGASVPRLRGLALGHSPGDFALLTEDHCVAAPDWIEGLLAARADCDVVGGSMDNRQTERALDWGAYFAEYGFFGASAGNGAFMPTGANVAYTKDVAAKVSEWCSAGLWENVAHGRLLEQGARFRFEPAATVYQNKNYRFAAFCRDRFEHGLSYARRRVLDEGTAKRWLYLATSPILPFLLTKRVGQACWSLHARSFLRALPFTFAFLAAWSLGEAVGYLTGSETSSRPGP